jgi:hypothetical protein
MPLLERTQMQTRLRNRLVVLATALVLLLGVVAGISLHSPVAKAASATIGVDAASNLGALQAQMSTNYMWNTIPDSSGNQAKLDALAPPLLRIHAGDDGTTPPTAPDQVRGSWDFTNLDAMVNQVRHYGGRPMLNIKFAPRWQWSCSNPGTGQTGQVVDQTYVAFGQYMARLVAYYNTGTMTDENGVVHNNPAGTANRIDDWEIWNEPDGAWETPCVPPASLDPQGESLTPDQYVTMWNASAGRMRAVDSTIKLIGPVTANPLTSHTPDYVPDLLTNGTIHPDAISFHGYGGWQNSESDYELLRGGSNSEGLDGIVADIATIRSYDTIGAPIWFTEGNVNADWGLDPHSRPTNAYGVAYGASAFAQMGNAGIGLMNWFNFIDSAQYGDISDQNGATRLPYWRDMVLHQFPVGSTLLSVTNTLSPGVSTLAIKKANGDVVVLLANRQPDNTTIVGGAGLGGTMTVNLSNFTPASVTLQQIDSTSSAASAPAVQVIPVSGTQSVVFPGYGMAVLTFSGASGPTPTPTPIPPTPTPTPPPAGNDFSIAAAPTTLSIAQGNAGTSTISTAVTSGSAATVGLAATVSPTGPTAALVPTSVTAGGTSTLTVSVGAAVPVGTYTVTVTGTEGTAVHSATVTVTVTTAAPPGAIVNGDFETGDFTGWTFTGTGQHSITSTDKHGGLYGGLLGVYNNTSNGASNLVQTFTVPTGKATLSMWYSSHNPQVNGTAWDYTRATLKDNTAGTAAIQLFKVAPVASTWTQKTTPVFAGHSYTLTLINYSSNSNTDVFWSVFDDVTLS